MVTRVDDLRHRVPSTRFPQARAIRIRVVKSLVRAAKRDSTLLLCRY